MVQMSIGETNGSQVSSMENLPLLKFEVNLGRIKRLTVDEVQIKFKLKAAKPVTIPLKIARFRRPNPSTSTFLPRPRFHIPLSETAFHVLACVYSSMHGLPSGIEE